MTRPLTAGMLSAIAAKRGELVYLFEIETSGGVLHLCTAPVDVAWNGETWEGIGGTLVFDSIDETPDPAGQGVGLTLSGVDQTVIASVLTNQVRGYPVAIWWAHLDDGDIVPDPLEIFRGLQLADYQISEKRSQQPGTVTVKTRVKSRLARLRNAQVVHTNESSHNDMLARAGLPTGDTFFRNVAGLVGRDIYWGTNRPTRWRPDQDDGRRGGSSRQS